MSDRDVDMLMKRLEALPLERASSIEHLQRINVAESKTLKKLTAAQATVSTKGECPFVIGNTLRITDHVCSEHVTVGTVRKVSNTRVTIRNTSTGNEYQRAWWNLELVHPTTDTRMENRKAQK